MHKKITSIMLLAAVVALAGCPKPQSPLPDAINASQLRVAVNGNLEAQGYALARSMDVVSQPFAGLQLYVYGEVPFVAVGLPPIGTEDPAQTSWSEPASATGKFSSKLAVIE